MTGGREGAETLALRALAWIASDAEMLGEFLAATGVTSVISGRALLEGVTPDDLRRQAGSAIVLVAVLDFLVADDQRVVRFCDAAGLRYDLPLQARSALGGAAETHWT